MPDRRILLFKRDSQTESVLLQDGRPIEWATARPYAMNDVFLGVCGQVNESLKSAFIRIDEGHEAILPLARFPDGLKAGRRLPVQIRRIREEEGKGPVVDTVIRLPGRYAVAMPGGKSIRRSCLSRMESGLAEERFRQEEAALLELWKLAADRLDNGPAPRLLLSFGDPASIALREWDDGAPILVEGVGLFDEIRMKAPDIGTRRRMSLQVPESQGSLRDVYGLESARREMESETVPLACGGFLAIQRTSTLVAVDVNSGRASADGPGQLAWMVNEEAVRETARQMRLRNLSGMILIDFMRLDREEDKSRLTALIKSETADDRGKVRVEGWTRLGLMETARSGF